MTCVFTRSALVHWGKDPAPNVAYVVDGKVVTWSDVMKARRERQDRKLERVQEFRYRRASKIWVSFYDMDLMGGWQAFIETRDGYEWIDRDRSFLIPQLLKLFPLVLDFGNEREAWRRWKVDFARTYRRRVHHGEPVGVCYVWHDGRDLHRI